MADRAERSKPGFRLFRSGRTSAVDAHPEVEPASLCLVTLVDSTNRGSLAAMVAGARPHIAHWIVVDIDDDIDTDDDTDSRDEPHRAATRHIGGGFDGIPGEWVRRPGLAPHEALTHALGLVPPSLTHVLILDPHMTLEVEGSLVDMLAVAPGDVMPVRVDDNGFVHRRPLLARNRADWVVNDDVQHSLRAAERVTTVAFEPARVARAAHGSQRTAALARDRERLYARLATEPSNVSVMFRLAKTLSDLGETDPAIHWFTRCAAVAGRGEEAYCAWYFIGDLHLLDNNLDAAESAYMWALQMRPARVEAYHQLALISNLSRDFPRARMWAEAGMLQRESADTMYLQPWMRRWGLPFQWATAAWWTGDARAARSMFLSLNESRLLVEPWATQARQFAARPLPGGEQLRYG